MPEAESDAGADPQRCWAKDCRQLPTVFMSMMLTLYMILDFALTFWRNLPPLPHRLPAELLPNGSRALRCPAVLESRPSGPAWPPSLLPEKRAQVVLAHPNGVAHANVCELS
jgi:hypothetical protein